MELEFEKWHGCENDFILLFLEDLHRDVMMGSLTRLSPSLCHRHKGVGADGLLVLHKRSKLDALPYEMSIINSDGTLAKNCGNGLRCGVGFSLKAFRETSDEPLEWLELDVSGHKKICQVTHRFGHSVMVRSSMGRPLVGHEVPWKKAIEKDVDRILKTFLSDYGKTSHVDFEWDAVDLQNPHLVIDVDCDGFNAIQVLGPLLQKLPGLDGVNVHLVTPEEVELPAEEKKRLKGIDIGAKRKVYVWERGAGLTRACGSGAVAVGAVSYEGLMLERGRWCAVNMPGGFLYVGQKASGDEVELWGPAEFVFRGKVEI